jgi:hypothetical protein
VAAIGEGLRQIKYVKIGPCESRRIANRRLQVCMQNARRFVPLLNRLAKISSNCTFHTNGVCTILLSYMPTHFSPSSVQFKGEINGAFPCKRHQKQHLEFCTAYLLSRGSGVRISPGAPLHFFSMS